MSPGADRRTLWLLRHAKSDWDTGAPDHERPLNSRGGRDAEAAGRLLSKRGWRPDLVLCSSALRTRQTWERAAEAGARAGEVRIERGIYAASETRLLQLVRQVDDAVTGLLLVGHGPGLPDLADGLGTRPDPADVWQRMDAKFPTAAVAVLRFDGSWADLEAAELIAFEVPRG
jgi:phosphohistidine phosphatase